MVDVFFLTEKDRDEWLYLNAMEQIEYEKTYNSSWPPRTFEQALNVAKGQLSYDVKKGILRKLRNPFKSSFEIFYNFTTKTKI